MIKVLKSGDSLGSHNQTGRLASPVAVGLMISCGSFCPPVKKDTTLSKTACTKVSRCASGVMGIRMSLQVSQEEDSRRNGNLYPDSGQISVNNSCGGSTTLMAQNLSSTKSLSDRASYPRNQAVCLFLEASRLVSQPQWKPMLALGVPARRYRRGYHKKLPKRFLSPGNTQVLWRRKLHSQLRQVRFIKWIRFTPTSETSLVTLSDSTAKS